MAKRTRKITAPEVPPTLPAPAAAPVDPAPGPDPAVHGAAAPDAIDWNDPLKRDPYDPNFAGTGLDLSVYGGNVSKA